MIVRRVQDSDWDSFPQGLLSQMLLLRHFRAILRLGPRKYFKEVWSLREFRGGTLVGSDALGNRYYEIADPVSTGLQPTQLPFYRKRYVQLADGSDEASLVPAEWRGWLHNTNDDAPNLAPEGVYWYPSWRLPHTPNWTGTENRYVPYSTTVAKIVPYKADEVIKSSRAFMLGNPALPRPSQTR